METLAATTPSPTSGIHTPPTPKYGYGDSWEPFSPRKSTRLSSQRSSTAAARTPSPHSSHHQTSHSHYLRSPRASKRYQLDNMATPAPSPKKRHMPVMDSPRRVSGMLTAEGAASAAAALGLPGKTDGTSNKTTISSKTGMLPTPSKTPARKASEQNSANIKVIARNLFPGEDEVMPSPKKKRAKKYTGISMDSFTAVDDDESFQIYTDSRERVPEVDNSIDNPFYGDNQTRVAEPIKRRSTRRQVAIPGEASQTLDEAIRREDGLVYVFRGKKIFRKFSEQAEDSNGAQTDGQDEAEASLLGRPLTRSAIKPRLLFPDHHKRQQPLDDDEEAVTDIEDHAVDEADIEPQTPAELVDAAPATPETPRFAVSPPRTVRVTRSGIKAAEESTLMKPGRGGKRSPFDGWRRVKGGSGPGSQGHKRPAEDVLTTESVSKRARAL